MSPFPPEPARPTTTARTAQLRLRGLQHTARVTWPTPQGQNVTPAMVVLFTDPRFPDAGAESHDIVISPPDVVVLSASAGDLEEAWSVLTWAADHAAEIGADPARLTVIGDELAERAVERALERGWPPVAMFSMRQIRRAVD